MGFSEVDAVDDLIACFHQQIGDIQIIVKLHPLQPHGDFDRLEKRWNSVVKIRWVLQADALELASISDIVAGFYSNLLLSAAALGKSILRYFPGPAQNDPFRHFQSMPRVSKQQLPLLPLRNLMARYE
jgi:hypothetical protein